jgi:hypothetical protein
VRLNQLDAKLYRVDGNENAEVARVAEADFLLFQCPKCAQACRRVLRDDGTGYAEGAHFISVPFAAHDGRPPMRQDPHHPQPRWSVSGLTLSDITTGPSIQVIGGCAWHGWVKNGDAS